MKQLKNNIVYIYIYNINFIIIKNNKVYIYTWIPGT